MSNYFPGVPLARGLAVCTLAKGFEPHLVEGERYYIREIPNMRGHVLVIGNDQVPLVGVHLERFEIELPGDGELRSLPRQENKDEY